MPSKHAVDELRQVIPNEYEHEPVPTHSRKSLPAVAAVWLGFPMIMTSAVFGGVITYNLGFWRALLAIAAGNLILIAYVGSLSYLAGKSGESFALTARKVFGTRGYLIATAFLSTLVIGWFAFQTGMVGDIITAEYGWPGRLTIVFAGLGFVAVTFLGIRSIAAIGVVGSFLFAALALIAIMLASSDRPISSISDYSAGAGAGALSFGACVTIVVACFIDSGTMTSDFTRWSKSGKEAFFASLAAFPFGNIAAQATGVVVVALGAATNPGTTGGDFMHILTSHGSLLSAIALIFVIVNLGSVCAHCLYNGAVGYSQLTGRPMRLLVVALGLIGIVAAATGLTNHFLTWLNILGIFVPPIGVVIILSSAAAKTSMKLPTKKYRWEAFSAWFVGAGGALTVHFLAPTASDAVVAIVLTGATYFILTRFCSGATPAIEESKSEISSRQLV